MGLTCSVFSCQMPTPWSAGRNGTVAEGSRLFQDVVSFMIV
jgi:hypothetical protein